MKDFQEFLEEIMEANSNIEPNNEMAHYTSVDAFISIAQSVHTINNQNCLKFWFTDAYCTNDKQEGTMGYNYVMDAFADLESCLTNKEDCFLITNYEVEISKSIRFKNNTPDQIRYWLTHDEATPYIMSLTRKVDDMDMWLKTYGNAGNGLCMVFNFAEMDTCRLQADFFIHGPFSVVYGDRIGYHKEKNVFMEIILKEYNSFLKEVNLLNDFDMILERKIQAIGQVCGLISSFMKKEEWHSEWEKRLVALRHFYPIDVAPKPIIHNNGKGHIEVDIPVSCLKKIIIGPCTNNEARERVLLNAERIGITNSKVIVSEKPIR